MSLRALVPAELPAVQALLAASDLPIDDIDDASISLVGAFPFTARQALLADTGSVP